MRPVKLIMSAFGSYSGEQIIDFTKIQGGLFLITGDTGAGKTTIFDAIMYALYDRTSGGRRDGNMMRSQYAAEDTDTFVEYVFRYRGEEYTIRRNPEYLRAGKRKAADGSVRLVRESAGVSLILPDGTEYRGKKKETDQKIRGIIGLDEEQFSQIAMIAQGDFLRLLHAGSKERRKIFSDIFQTQICRKMQEELREASKDMKRRLLDNESEIRKEMGRIDAGTAGAGGETDQAGTEENDVRSRWEQLCSLEMPPAGDVLSVIREITDAGTAASEKLEKEEEENSGKAEELRLRIEKKQETNKLFALLDSTEASIQNLENSREEKEALRAQAEKGERAERARSIEVQALRTKKEQEKTAEEIRAEKEWKSAHEADEEILRKQYETAEKNQTEHEPELLREISLLREVMPRYEKVRKLHADLKKKTGEMELCMEECRKASGDYEEKYRLFFREQAGLLAKDLSDGLPCPVCGSLSHPRKAELSGNAPDQETVEAARRKRETLDQKRAEKQSEYEKVRSALETEEAFIRQYTAGEEAARRRLEQLEEQVRTGRTAVKEAREKYTKSAEENRRRSGRLESLERQEKSLEQRFAEEQEAFRAEIRKQQFQDQEEYREARKWIEGWREKAGELKKFEEQLLRLRARKDTLRSQAEGKKPEDVEPDKKELNRLSEILRRCRERRLEIHGKNTVNLSAYRQLELLFADQESLREEYEVLDHLERTANGSLTGSAKLDFETYVQRKYFRQIIHAANRRLARMTSDGFLLQCREIRELKNQGQAGLDLDVYDLVTDSVRDVRSLSGGESFMAALSMALGLADIVQNTAGAVSLETMFVDEGFGSLDDASRDRAISILKELAGEKGLVGIISHVNELKEQIDCRLTVKKTGNGSRAVWEL